MNYFTENFKSIKVIQFFGGEPTLASDKIIYVMNKFNYMKKSSLIEEMPRFGIVTNGVKFPSELIKVFSQYNSSITLSIDGPKDINDELRVDIFNEGSFKKIKDTYSLLYNNGIRQIGVESTYTNKHIENHISLVDLVEFFKKEFNCNIPHIVPVGIEDDNFLSISKNLDVMLGYVEELVEYTFENIFKNHELNTISILLGIIRRISLKNTYNKICPAGVSTFSIAADKKIQPCFMYTSDEDISLGNIYSSATDVINKSIEFDDKINKKKHVKVCESCFIRNICSSCLGNFKIEETQVTPKSIIYCEILRHMTQCVILKLADIKSDPSKWNELVNILCNN